MLRSVIYYSTATCNLQCNYCFIHKNSALDKIDKMLDESFQGDYYFEYTKKVFSDPNQLEEVQIWGGEPFLRMDRVHDTLLKVFNYYPNLNELFISTNFVNIHFIHQFKSLLKLLQGINKKIKFTLQISIDGPVEYTDSGRGQGVTSKFLEKYDDLLETVYNYRPSNVSLQLRLKPTLSTENMYRLNDRNEIIRYYKFFENVYQKYILYKWNENEFVFRLPIWSIATPSPHTKLDGIIFANIMKSTKEIEEDIANNIDTGLKYYKDISPFRKNGHQLDINFIDYRFSGPPCASGVREIGLLPNNMLTGCHMAFVNLISDFEHVKNLEITDTKIDKSFFDPSPNHPFAFSENNFESWLYKIMSYYNESSTARLMNLVNLIRIEALSGNILSKYQNEQEAIKAAKLMTSVAPYCIRNNLMMGGSMLTYPVGTVRLFLNGAEEYFYD